MADRGSPAAVEVFIELDHVAAEDRSRFEVRSGGALNESGQPLARVAGKI